MSLAIRKTPMYLKIIENRRASARLLKSLQILEA